MVLIAVGIGVVVTVSVTLKPSWLDRFARKGEGRPVAMAPARPAEQKGAEVARTRMPLPTEKRELDKRYLADRSGGPAVPGARETGTFNAVEGSGEISPGLAASGNRPGDQVGERNVPAFTFDREKSSRGGGTLAEAYEAPSTSAVAKNVGQIGLMPAIAAAPGPRADQPAGVVTQVGEPLYTGAMRERSGVAPQAAPPAGTTKLPAAMPETQDRLAQVPASQPVVPEAMVPAAEGSGGTKMPQAAPPVSLPGELRRVLMARRVALVTPAGPSDHYHYAAAAAGSLSTQPASQPASQPTSQPTSGPTSRPASQPASAPSSAP